MKIIENDKLAKEEVYELYESVEWIPYLKDIDKLMRGIENSLYIATIRKNEKLIGMIRVVGDGETIIYIQDIIIHPTYQNNGFGESLLQHVLNRYKMVRQKLLLTDNSEQSNNFYKKNNGKNVGEIQCVSYFFE